MTLPPLLPERASTLATRFEYLFWYITIVTAVAGLAVYGFMLYCCVRYRRSATDRSTPRILGSHRLELAWTVIPLLIFLTFFGGGVIVYSYAFHPPQDAMEVFVIGKQWMWKAQYPNGQRVIIGGNPRNMTAEERNQIGGLVLPVNRDVKLTLISEDVIHDFGVPAFRSKMDVLPGRYTQAWYHPTKVGSYHVFCDQYCGTWHSLMVGQVHVVGEAEFDAWLAGFKPIQGSNNPVDGSLAHAGEQQFLRLQCLKCHTGSTSSEAPNLPGLYGSEVTLQDGTKVIVDEAFIIESILRPRAKVVQNYKPNMPSYEGQLTAEELNALVHYIRGMKELPKATDRQNPPVGAPTERKQPPTSPEKK